MCIYFPDQGKIADIVSDLFDISHEYIGTLVSKIANVSQFHSLWHEI
jgi:hypothetical protein